MKAMINPTSQPVSEYMRIENVLGVNETFQVEQGHIFSELEIAFETYGKLNAAGDNAVLLLHALSGDSHVARHNENESMKGWWDDFVGPGKPVDTNHFYVVCSNVIGGCRGSLGPASLNPKTNKPYAMEFPVITIGDMVRAQRQLMKYLGVPHLYAVIGGSMGGMQALEWSILFPDFVDKVVGIATTAGLSTQSMAFDVVGRQAIMSDPEFRNGNYYDISSAPMAGLSVARMIAHITYLSEDSMNQKFGRKLQFSDRLKYHFDVEFQIESYLKHQGEKFVSRFDANSYLYMTKAMDYFDLHSRGKGSLGKAFQSAKSKFLIVSYTTDWLFPSSQGKEIVNALRNNGLEVSFANIEYIYGHDSFLLDSEYLPNLVRAFLYEGR